VSASPLSSPRKRRQALTLLLGLSAGVASARLAQAAGNAVQIDCPELTREQAAEIESRVRASLLTTEGEATVAITCRTGGADVRVERAPESVVVAANTSPPSFRDDVLRAVEQALQELTRRQARAPDGQPQDDDGAPPPTPAASPPPEPAPSPALPTPTTTAPTPAPLANVRERAWLEILGSFVGESWSDRLALGGSVGAARSTRTLWYGLRASVLRPVTQAPSFSAFEAQVALELGVQPDFAAGLRLSFALGPSVLFVQPQADLTSNTGRAKTSLFAAVHVSRPVWLGRWGLLPELGVRLFVGERGVTVDTREQLVLAGFTPQLSLGVAYRVD